MAAELAQMAEYILATSGAAVSAKLLLREQLISEAILALPETLRNVFEAEITSRVHWEGLTVTCLR